MKTTIELACRIAAILMAILLAGCSENPEAIFYQGVKCNAVAISLGQEADAQVALSNANLQKSKIKKERLLRISVEALERLRKEFGSLDSYGAVDGIKKLQEVYESNSCQKLYRPLESSEATKGIPEYVPGEAPETAGSQAPSDAQVDQTDGGQSESQRASTSDVVIEPPTLGSEADHSSKEVTRPTQIFQPEDTIYLQVPYRGTGSVEHKLSTKWTFHGESGDVPVYEDFKFIHTDGNLASLFIVENQNSWGSGRYTIEVRLDGQTMRAVSFTVAEPMQLGSGVSQEDTVTPERPIPVPRCPPAVSDLERAMCRNPGLVSLDKKLSELHRQAQATTNDVWELDQEQGKWRRDRRDPCRDDIACLTAAYQERIDALSP